MGAQVSIMYRRFAGVVAGVVLAAIAPGVARPAPEGTVIQMIGFRFVPADATIPTGMSVTWQNAELVDYPIVGATHELRADETFASPPIHAGAGWTKRFTTPGTIVYRCARHPLMTGRLAVVGDPVPDDEHEVLIVEPDQADPDTWGYDPADLAVPAGATIVFHNTGTAEHTATADDGSFDSGAIPKGGVYRRTFAAPGRFTYSCAPHPWMTGVITVSDEPEPRA